MEKHQNFKTFKMKTIMNDTEHHLVCKVITCVILLVNPLDAKFLVLKDIQNWKKKSYIGHKFISCHFIIKH